MATQGGKHTGIGMTSTRTRDRMIDFLGEGAGPLVVPERGPRLAKDVEDHADAHGTADDVGRAGATFRGIESQEHVHRESLLVAEYVHPAAQEVDPAALLKDRVDRHRPVGPDPPAQRVA